MKLLERFHNLPNHVERGGSGQARVIGGPPVSLVIVTWKGWRGPSQPRRVLGPVAKAIVGALLAPAILILSAIRVRETAKAHRITTDEVWAAIYYYGNNQEEIDREIDLNCQWLSLWGNHEEPR